MTLTPHKIDRAEWERRFKLRFWERGAFAHPDVTNPQALADMIVPAELESWPVAEGDWEIITPEEAADEQLSNWEDDGD